MRATTRCSLHALALLPLFALQACATPRNAQETPVTQPDHAAGAPARDTPASAAFTLQPGQARDFAGAGTLRYGRVASDSRCPPDRQCVWAGDAIVAFSWTPAGGAAEAFELHTGLEPRSKALAGGMLVLESLARGAAPAATLRLDPAR